MDRLLRITPLVGLLLGAPQIAFADAPLSTANDADETQAAIAYNSEADQYMVVFKAQGALAWQLRDADGTLLDSEYNHANFIRWYPGDDLREPRVTYRPGDDQYVVTAVRETVTGPITDTTLALVGLDADTGARLWYDDVYTPGNPVIRTPDVMGDTFPNCCTIVTWKEGFGTLKAQRYNSSGLPQGGTINIFTDSGRFSDHAFNPRLAYQRSPRDDFAVVYQKSRGPDSVIQARSIEPVSGTLGAERTIAVMDANPRTSYGEKFPGGPDIVYEEGGGNRYMVTWRDEDSIKVATLNTTLQSPAVRIVYSESPPYYTLRPGTPELIQASGTSRYLVTHPRRYDGMYSDIDWVQGWWLYVYGPSDLTYVSSQFWAEPVGASVGAYSPVTQEAFIVWDRMEPDLMGPRDLYYTTTPRP